MTQEKKQALKEKIMEFISNPDNYDFDYLKELNENSSLNNNGGDIESLIQALTSNDIISYYYEMVTTNTGDSDTDYSIINYWSEKLGKSVLIEQEPSDSFDSIEELIDAIVNWEEQCELFESKIIFCDANNLIGEPSIFQRIGEMKTNDEKTGEHPGATDEQYREWATEEWEANHGDYIKLEEEDKIKKLADYILSLHQDEALDGDATEKLANTFLAELNKLFANN